MRTLEAQVSSIMFRSFGFELEVAAYVEPTVLVRFECDVVFDHSVADLPFDLNDPKIRCIITLGDDDRLAAVRTVDGQQVWPTLNERTFEVGRLPLSDYTDAELAYLFNKYAHQFSKAAGIGALNAAHSHYERMTELGDEILRRLQP